MYHLIRTLKEITLFWFLSLGFFFHKISLCVLIFLCSRLRGFTVFLMLVTYFPLFLFSQKVEVNFGIDMGSECDESRFLFSYVLVCGVLLHCVSLVIFKI